MNLTYIDPVALSEFFSHLGAKRPDLIQAALASGMPATVANHEGYSALAVAARVGCEPTVRLLIDHGAYVNKVDTTVNRVTSTPLIEAIKADRFDLADILLNAGADPTICDHKRYNALHVLIDGGRLDDPTAHPLAESATRLPLLRQNILDFHERGFRIFKRLVQREGIATALTIDLRTPLHLVLQRSSIPEVAEELIFLTPDLDALTPQNSRLINRTWSARNIWKAELLVSRGVDINSRDVVGVTAIGQALDAGAVQGLLRLGADPHHLDDSGRTTLAVLIDSRSLDDDTIGAAAELLAAGVDTKHKDVWGKSVETRLTARTDDEAQKLLRLIKARDARNVMSRAALASAKRNPH